MEYNFAYKSHGCQFKFMPSGYNTVDWDLFIHSITTTVTIRMVITQPSHSNTRLFSPVFRCHLNTGPFANRTTFDHFVQQVEQLL